MVGNSLTFPSFPVLVSPHWYRTFSIADTKLFTCKNVTQEMTKINYNFHNLLMLDACTCPHLSQGVTFVKSVISNTESSSCGCSFCSTAAMKELAQKTNARFWWNKFFVSIDLETTSGACAEGQRRQACHRRRKLVSQQRRPRRRRKIKLSRSCSVSSFSVL